MSLHEELEHLKVRCKRLEMDIAHLRHVISRMRSHDNEEFSRDLELIRKLRERVEVLESRSAAVNPDRAAEDGPAVPRGESSEKSG